MIFGILVLKGFSLKLQKKLSFWLLAFLSAGLFISPSFAQANGEIININLADQIVFINLTNEDLKLGDIVDIYKNEDIFLTLEVIGTSDVVSKLASLPQTPPSVLKERFQQIKVGDVALKATRKTRSAGEVLFTYTENPGADGIPYFGNNTVLMTAVTPAGIPVDVTISEDCKIIDIQVQASVKLVALPTDMHEVGDNFAGVNGAAGILVTNP